MKCLLCEMFFPDDDILQNHYQYFNEIDADNYHFNQILILMKFVKNVTFVSFILILAKNKRILIFYFTINKKEALEIGHC